MKTKKIDKKLVLQKSTVSNLDPKEMNHVQGGGPIEDFIRSLYKVCY
jgi:hypothetical protein